MLLSARVVRRKWQQGFHYAHVYIWSAIRLDSLPIPYEIQTIYNPTSFWPFEIQTGPDFRSPLYSLLLIINDWNWKIVKLKFSFFGDINYELKHSVQTELKTNNNDIQMTIS